MSAPQPFLSAGLPGLTFGLSLGRGLSIQLDPAGHVIGEKEEMNPEEDICYIKNVTLPTGMLVIHLYGLHELSIPDLTECILYVTFSIASTRKATSQKKYNIKTPTVLFNEIKMLPFVVNPKPVQQMNKIIVLVYACSPGEEHAVSKAKHRIVGRYEAHLHKLLKNITMKEVGCLLNKKGNIVGSIEFECCVTYGAFGYGQSYQLKNNLHSPADLVKMSLFPRIPPVDSEHSFRGTIIHPRKLQHPTFVPLQNEAIEDLEPEISATYNDPVLECPDFPLLKQHMQRISQIQAAFSKQPTRTKRISFLRKLLQDGGAVPHDVFEEDVSDDETKEKEAPIPQTLAVLMNAAKFISHAPGIIARRKKSTHPQSNELTVQEPCSSQGTDSSPFEMERAETKKLFARRRQSSAPSSK